MPRAKGLFHKSIAPMHELKIREKTFPDVNHIAQQQQDTWMFQNVLTL